MFLDRGRCDPSIKPKFIPRTVVYGLKGEDNTNLRRVVAHAAWNTREWNTRGITGIFIASVLYIAAGENVSRNCKRTNIYVCLICLSDADDNRCTRTNRASDLYISCTNSKTRAKSYLGEGGRERGRGETRRRKRRRRRLYSYTLRT